MPFFRTLCGFLLLVAPTFAAEHTLRILGKEEAIKGELVSIDGKELVFKTGGETLHKPLASVLSIDLQSAPPLAIPATQVELTDGSVLNCKPDSVIFNGKTVDLTVLPDVKIKVPITALSYVLKQGHDAKVRDNSDWKAILKSRKNQDMLVKWGQGRLNGIGGTFTDGKDASINFVLDGRDTAVPIDLNIESIQGCAFVNRLDPGSPVTICRLTDMNQNQLRVAKLELKDGALVATTVFGGTFTYRPDQVARLDYNSGKLSFLSDLEATVMQEPGEDFFDRHYRRDKNADGGPIQISGTRFAKGLFLPAPTKLSYKLNGDYNEFYAQVGVDDTVRGRSHVRLIIEGDGKELFNAEFKRADKRREIKVNIKDVQELRIFVEPVEPLNLAGNHLDLADAKINK